MAKLIVSCLILAVFYAVGLVLTLRPQKIVQLHAGQYRDAYWRWYGGKPVDKTLDRMQFPFSRFIVGSFSEYVTLAVEEPARFPRAIWFFRVLGILFLSVALLATIAFVLALSSGQFWINP